MWELIVIAGVVFAIILVSRLTANGPLRKALRQGDIGALTRHILSSDDDDDRATAFDRTVKTLWDSYRRDLAAQLIKRVAPSASGIRIVQYWIRQVQEVEPEIARERFDPEFLADCFNPELAMRCGKTG